MKTDYFNRKSQSDHIEIDMMIDMKVDMHRHFDISIITLLFLKKNKNVTSICRYNDIRQNSYFKTTNVKKHDENFLKKKLTNSFLNYNKC